MAKAVSLWVVMLAWKRWRCANPVLLKQFGIPILTTRSTEESTLSPFSPPNAVCQWLKAVPKLALPASQPPWCVFPSAVWAGCAAGSQDLPRSTQQELSRACLPKPRVHWLLPWWLWPSAMWRCISSGRQLYSCSRCFSCLYTSKLSFIVVWLVWLVGQECAFPKLVPVSLYSSTILGLVC